MPSKIVESDIVVYGEYGDGTSMPMEILTVVSAGNDYDDLLPSTGVSYTCSVSSFGTFPDTLTVGTIGSLPSDITVWAISQRPRRRPMPEAIWFRIKYTIRDGRRRCVFTSGRLGCQRRSTRVWLG